MTANFLIRAIRILLPVLFISMLPVDRAFAQLIYQPYSYQFYQKLNQHIYAPGADLHTSIKPYIITDSSSIRPAFDSLMNPSGEQPRKSWLQQVLFKTHLLEVNNKEYTFYLDFLPDLQVGKEFTGHRSTYLNTRGYQLSGTIGSRFLFYTSGYENQGKFPNYEDAYIKKTGMIPGQAYNKGSNSTDWSLVTALIAYKLSNAVTLELGNDKTFIGDGYRSLLLSDYAAAYPLLRVRADLGKKVQYMAMAAYMEDQQATQFNAFFNNRRKWAVFHYIDWNISKRASLGFFNALITAEANDQGQSHGFDLNYVNPLFFASSLGPANRIADHTLFGFNGKYKVLNQSIIYGQFLYDQGTTTSDGSGKKAWQLGFRGSDLFKIRKLNYLAEFNNAASNTYTAQTPIVNYTELSEPLAHPYGSNFREWLGLLNYTIQKFDFQGEFIHAQIGPGLNTSLTYKETTASYLLNPKYNLRIEAGGLLRSEKDNLTTTRTAMITFGLRSSFRNLYHDF